MSFFLSQYFLFYFFFFFFSSRRRHTRFDCDWSSDVCSSDLPWTGTRGSNPRPFAPWTVSSLSDQLWRRARPGCTSAREFRGILLCPPLLFGAQMAATPSSRSVVKRCALLIPGSRVPVPPFPPTSSHR